MIKVSAQNNNLMKEDLKKFGEIETNNVDIVMLEIKDLQKILKIGKNSAYALMKSECFPSTQLGRKWLVSAEALKSWLKDNEYSKIILE